MRQQKSGRTIEARTKEYRPFTKVTAASVAKKFKIQGKEEILFDLVTRATQHYEQFLLKPDYQQQKSARSKLNTALGKTVMVIEKNRRALEQQPQLTALLQGLGEILTYEGLEKLLGRRIGRNTLPAPRPGRNEEVHRLYKASHASRAGPELLISLFNLMKSTIDQPLIAPPKGGRPIKHLFRHWIAVQLAMNYDQFFDTWPTTAPTGRFAKFCLAVLEAMVCETDGFVDSLPDIADDSHSHFAPNRNKRTRRMKRA